MVPGALHLCDAEAREEWYELERPKFTEDEALLKVSRRDLHEGDTATAADPKSLCESTAAR